MEAVMSKPISIGQSHNLMSVLANNVDWSQIDGEAAQRIINDPRCAGRNFVEFLRRIGTLPRTLKFLKLIADGIMIVTEPFTKEPFFTKNGPVKFYFWDYFKDLILTEIPESVPVFRGAIIKTQLTKATSDSTILDELGNPVPFTVSEFAAIIHTLLMRQPDGEDGTLLADSYANVFYVKRADERMIMVAVNWLSNIHRWGCGVRDLNYNDWGEGHCVFSRS
jgi:hypothetical protein